MITLSIIVLNYNTKDLTKKCIQSLTKQYQKQLTSGEFEIILVDNASTDGSIETIGNFQFPISNFQLIKNKHNVGFAKGNNIGAEKAKGKYVLFLNSDTQVQDEGLLGMIDYLDTHEKAAILGGRLCNVNGSNQASAGTFYNLVNVFFLLLGFERLGLLRVSPHTVKSVDWVSGASMMVRRSLFDTLKGFDEHFFMYMEDMELCFRVKKMGHEVVFYPNVHIFHKELGSSNRVFAIMHIYYGLLYFYKKHKGYFQYVFIKLLLVTKAMAAICIGTLLGDSGLTNTYRKALRVAI